MANTTLQVTCADTPNASVQCWVPMTRILVLLLTVCSLASAAPKARIKIDTERTVGQVDPHLFGNFAEHLGRCIYGGIFEEGSPLSDADGYRKDVMEATR